MTRTTKNIAIEKNRTALLRLVRWWLLVATMFGADRVLPSRIGQWVSDIILKAEQATYYLQIASGFMQTNASLPDEQHGQITIKAVVSRLKAVKRALIRLKPGAKNWLKPYPFINPNNYPRNSALYKSGLRLRTVFSCRAPPCFDAVGNLAAVNRNEPLR